MIFQYKQYKLVYRRPNDAIVCNAVLSTEVALSKTVNIEKHFVEIEDHGIKLRLTIVDTSGFGDMVDASQWYEG